MENKWEEQGFSSLRDKFWLVREAKDGCGFLINADMDSASICNKLDNFFISITMNYFS